MENTYTVSSPSGTEKPSRGTRLNGETDHVKLISKIGVVEANKENPELKHFNNEIYTNKRYFKVQKMFSEA